MDDLMMRIEAEIPRLRRYARHLTRRMEDADDLVQDCLARAIHRIDSFEPGTNLRAWLFVILRNGFISDLPRQRKADFLDWLAEDHPALASHGNQESHLQLREVSDACQSLSSEHQEVLQLICVDGLKYEEAAEILNVPVGTVRSRLSRARSALRIKLEEPAVAEERAREDVLAA